MFGWIVCGYLKFNATDYYQVVFASDEKQHFLVPKAALNLPEGHEGKFFMLDGAEKRVIEAAIPIVF